MASLTFAKAVIICAAILLTFGEVHGSTNSTNTTTLTPSNSPTSSPTDSPIPTNSTTTGLPTAAPTRSPTMSPSMSPTHSPTLSPIPNTTNITNTTASPTFSPTHSPTHSPTVSPSHSPTFSPTNAPTKPPQYTTTIGPAISVAQQLLVNFSLNFTSDHISEDGIISTMNTSLNLAYAAVHIPTNYISFQKIIFSHSKSKDGYYYCDIYTVIDAENKDRAYKYEERINSDPDTVAKSKFADNLWTILQCTENDIFDMSVPKMDIVAMDSGEGDESDTMEIVIWFLGVSAVCAVGALVLIICWRQFSGSTDKEAQNSINLEFLLDPNGSMDSPMHINGDANGDNERYHSLQQDRYAMAEEEDVVENVTPITSRKRKRKTSQFGRLSLDGDEDEDDGSLMIADRGIHDQQEEEYQQVSDEDANPLMFDDYDPPNMERL